MITAEILANKKQLKIFGNPVFDMYNNYGLYFFDYLLFLIIILPFSYVQNKKIVHFLWPVRVYIFIRYELKNEYDTYESNE
jgi:hypothetical protein